MAPLRRKPQGMSIRKPAWFAWRVFFASGVLGRMLDPEVLWGRRCGEDDVLGLKVSARVAVIGMFARAPSPRCIRFDVMSWVVQAIRFQLYAGRV